MKITDVTLTLQEPMRGISREVARTRERDGWNATTFHIYSHAGTHMDAPLHFDVSAGTIDQVPADRLVCRMHIARLAPAEPGVLINVEDIKNITEKFQAGEGIIFHTGWSRFSDRPEVYRDQLPRISAGLAEWLVENGAGMVAVEPPSVADVNNIEELTRVHRILMEGDVLIVEGLCNLESVEDDFVRLFALPLKIGGADGAPVRAIVIEGEDLAAEQLILKTKTT